jgi:hypothetical protein
MNPLNRQETEDLITDLYYNQKKTFREIQRIVRKSPRDIKIILNKVEPERSSLSVPSQAYRLFSEGKTLTQVAIILNLREPEATQLYLEYWKLNQLNSLSQIYEETNAHFSPFVELYRLMKAAGLNETHVIELLKIANNEIKSIKQVYQDLRREKASLNAKNLNAARTFQQLSNDISEEYKLLEQYRLSCKEEHIELAKLRIQKIRLESNVKQYQNNNEDYLKIKDVVKKTVAHTLMKYRGVLKIAFRSVIDSCRSDPIKFNILYHNLPLATRTTETQLILSDPINLNDNGLSTDKQSLYQHCNKDSVFEKLLLDEAEQFFSKMVEDLTQVCISRLVDTYISESILSQLTTRSHRSSEDMPSVYTHGNENTNQSDQNSI